jgi:hypothetical protein
MRIDKERTFKRVRMKELNITIDLNRPDVAVKKQKSNFPFLDILISYNHAIQNQQQIDLVIGIEQVR